MTARRSTFACAVLAAVAAALLSGCARLDPTPTPDPSPEDRVTAQTTLAARPSMEQALARYEQMQKQIRDRLDAVAGPHPWKVLRPASRDLCGREFGDTAGIVTYMAHWGFDGAISDADWPRARQVVTEVTAEYGFGTPTMAVDQPGRHRTTGADLDLGATYEFGTEVNTTMGVTTGCHLPEAVRGAIGR